MSYNKGLKRLIKVGDRVECIEPKSRFFGQKGTCEELDDKYNWPFIMFVPEIGERVDPSNWAIITHVKEESPARMIFQ